MKLKVYLAGGMKSGWQDKVRRKIYAANSEKFDRFEFFNPSTHGLTDSKEYTTWDLFHVQHCDIVFAYMEEANLSGYGLALEIGFAKALGKTIILVEEKSKTDESFARKFAIVRESATVVFEELDKGIDFLKRF